MRIGRQLERLRPVRLQAEGAPDAPDRRVRQPASFAIERSDQWMASAGRGREVSVRSITCATALLPSPFAQRRIMRQRSDRECATRWRRICASRNDRSPPPKIRAASGRPVPRAIEMTSIVGLGGPSCNEPYFSAK